MQAAVFAYFDCSIFMMCAKLSLFAPLAQPMIADARQSPVEISE
jgi:hypothetical protein